MYFQAYENLGTEVWQFDGVEDIKRHLDPSKYRARDEDFVGKFLPTHESSIAELNKPDFDAMALVQRMKEQIASKVTLPEVRSRKRVLRWADDGDELCLDRLRSGMDYFRSSQRQVHSGVSQCTILCELSTSCSVDPQTAFWRGAIALALADLLESNGYSVEIIMGSFLTNLFTPGPNVSIMTYKAKAMSDPLDLSSLVNLVSVWFFRTIVFTLHGSLAASKKRRVVMGHGYPFTPQTRHLELISTDKLLVISNVWSLKRAVECVSGLLSDFQ